MISRLEISKLSIPERLALLDVIWSSIDDEKIKITPAQKKELDRRLKKFESGKSTLFSWAEIKKSLREL